MKITVNSKKKKQEKIDWKKLPFGTVIEFKSGVRALVFNSGGGESEKPALLLLDYSRNFEQATGYLGNSIEKIIGQISEIIVEEIN